MDEFFGQLRLNSERIGATTIHLPMTPNAVCHAFVSLYVSIGGLPTTALGLQHWAINLQKHADPATPSVSGCQQIRQGKLIKKLNASLVASVPLYAMLLRQHRTISMHTGWPCVAGKVWRLNLATKPASL